MYLKTLMEILSVLQETSMALPYETKPRRTKPSFKSTVSGKSAMGKRPSSRRMPNKNYQSWRGINTFHVDAIQREI